MQKKCFSCSYVIIIISILIFFCFTLTAALPGKEFLFSKIESKVPELMEEGNIPGLSLVVIRKGEPDYMKGFGYMDLDTKKPVTPDTLFELGSCTKAFTALAALDCAHQGLLNLDDPVSKYLPWFYAQYKGKKYDITLKQFLLHTSGIPFKSISLIPETNAADALQLTVRKLEGIELMNIPGTQYEYATINYDMVGAVIEKAANMSYEEYISKNILIPLDLNNTIVGVDKDNPPANMAAGYKPGVFSIHKYDAPVFRGNNPAGYILSNGKDVARWLKMQMGLVETGLTPLILKSHKVDETMPFNGTSLSSYAFGWNVYLERLKRIEHGGDNPNFTSFIVFNPVDKIGVAVLANSRSTYTSFIANSIMNYIRGEGFPEPNIRGNNFHTASTVISILVGIFILAVFIFFISIFVDIFKGRRKFKSLTIKTLGKLHISFVLCIPFLIGIYLIPRTLAGVSMKTAIVFSPNSFKTAILLLLTAIGMCYIGLILSTLFPQRNKYLRSIPLVIVLSLLAGGANAVVIFLITTSIFSKTDLFYQLYNFALAFFVYIIGRKLLQTKLIRITFDIVYDLRMKLLEKVFYTSYQKFERIDRGRVITTLGNDTTQLGGSANVLVQLITSVVTAAGAFIYLAAIAFWATAVTLFVVAVIATLYSVVTRKTRVYFEQARDTQNVYMRLINGMIDGFKELSLQYYKKKEYKQELSENCDEFRVKSSTALIKFVNAFLIGESLLILVLGSVGYGIPRLFPRITPVTLMAFIMVLLYLIGPINGILNAIPTIARLRVSWNRVRDFIKDLPANMNPKDIEALDHSNPGSIEHIKAKGLMFTYDARNESEQFTVGPMDFEAQKGEIVFVIGGNGSGKTTLSKILTGLYLPDEGSIKIDGKEINNHQLGEYYSVVFGNYHLFERLYNVDLTGKEKEIRKYLEMLGLKEKVELEDDRFSTLDLSGGQRKRLALLQCYIEDRPIYLFDEIAADQDPQFRKFFYRELLIRMKEKGKVVIAITHDDHYFDVADKIIKMDMGKIESMGDRVTYSLPTNIERL